MAILAVPGFVGNWVIDTNTRDAWRVGRKGGTHDRRPIDTFQQEFQDAAAGIEREYRQATEPPDFSSLFEGFEFPGPSAEELELQRLQIDQIRQANAIAAEQLARENARRNAYARYVRGERWDPTSMEDTQGQQGARADALAAAHMERTEKAIRGELPVSAATARTIRQGADVVRERLRRNLGEGAWETSTPGIQAIAQQEESAGMLEQAEQQGLLERGIPSAINASEYARQSIGEYNPQEVPGLTNALQGLRQSRFAQIPLMQTGMNAMAQLYGLNQGAGRGMQAQSDDYVRRMMALASEGEGKSAGYGKLAGSIIGGLATAAIPYVGPFLAPFGAALGGYAAGGLTGGGFSPTNFLPGGYGIGGGGFSTGYGGGGGVQRMANSGYPMFP